MPCMNIILHLFYKKLPPVRMFIYFVSSCDYFKTFVFLSGTSGSGKSHASMLLLRQLFAVAGGGPETDAFKHLAAAFTVLRSLGSAKTVTNSESSRIVSYFHLNNLWVHV